MTIIIITSETNVTNIFQRNLINCFIRIKTATNLLKKNFIKGILRASTTLHILEPFLHPTLKHLFHT